MRFQTETAKPQRTTRARRLPPFAGGVTRTPFDPSPIGVRFRVFYVDPPWQYSDRLVDTYGAAELHYPALSVHELCDGSLRQMITEISEPDAVLFLWVTSPMLEEGLAVAKAWGFDPKATFVWDKVKHNYGHYNSVRHEFLLVAVKGSCLPDMRELHDSVVVDERSDRHSEKPVYFRELIARLYPKGNRLELFGRRPVEGWVVWGNPQSDYAESADRSYAKQV